MPLGTIPAEKLPNVTGAALNGKGRKTALDLHPGQETFKVLRKWHRHFWLAQVTEKAKPQTRHHPETPAGPLEVQRLSPALLALLPSLGHCLNLRKGQPQIGVDTELASYPQQLPGEEEYRGL
jgi:hypothetical protein